jgi:hypothetical protein
MKKVFLGSAVLAACLVLFAQSAPLAKRVKVAGGKTVTEYYASNVLVRLEAVSVKTNKDGSPIAGYTECYQDGKLVLHENWGPGPIRQRMFFRNGKQVLTETDKDGNGVPDWIVVNGDNGEAYAVFKYDNVHGIELMGTNAVAEYNEGLETGRGVVEVITNRLSRPNAE